MRIIRGVDRRIRTAATHLQVAALHSEWTARSKDPWTQKYSAMALEVAHSTIRLAEIVSSLWQLRTDDAEKG
jgi:hypothetical protein